MAATAPVKARVIKAFRDKENKSELRRVGDELTLTKTRFNELAKHKLGPFVAGQKEETDNA
ncbi:MAG: hypothetical protein LBR72_05255 [Oscillospiraceae bacterium]|jgi:hypothetical protein|nr:hypothetical protein [Oscillospiraceae bacterium]